MDSRRKRIGTHDGCFHCDEVLAIYLLQQLPEYSDAEIVRTRDPRILDECDVVVDVGCVYDPDNLRFDHHQNDFMVTWDSFFGVNRWDVKLSSAGLVYVHFGKRVLSLLSGWEESKEGFDKVYCEIYKRFVLEIDGIDNGTSMCRGPTNYTVRTGICNRVSQLFPSWNATKTREVMDVAFNEALRLVGTEFSSLVEYYTKCWWPARDVVSEAMRSRGSVDESRLIIVLTHSCPWRSHLLDLELEEQTSLQLQDPDCDVYQGIKFVVLPYEDGTWAVQVVLRKPTRSQAHYFEDRQPVNAAVWFINTGTTGYSYDDGAGRVGIYATRGEAIETAKLELSKTMTVEMAQPTSMTEHVQLTEKLMSSIDLSNVS